MIRPAQLSWILIAGVLLIGAGYLIGSHLSGDNVDEQGPVLPLKPQDLNAVTTVKVYRGDGSHATLTRDNNWWMVAERGYPADSGQVRKLLLDVASLQVEERKTADPALYGRLGVEDPANVQALSTGLDLAVNGKTYTLIVGKTAGTRAAYVRVKGVAQSVLATPQLAPDADPRHWLDRSLLDIPPEQIAQVQLQPKGSPPYVIKRGAAGAEPAFTVTPVPAGRSLSDPSAPANQAGALAALQFDDVRKASGQAPNARATYQTTDGLALTFTGLEAGETRYVSVAASATAPAAQSRATELNGRLGGWEFEVPGYRYDSLFRPLEQLLAPKAAASAPAAKASALPGPPTTLPFGPAGKANGAGGRVTPEQSH